ncbi:CDP-diacylglycerol-serine O-phosphatidyltransferase [Cystobasidiomycetes sp. EMM_F5]
MAARTTAVDGSSSSAGARPGKSTASKEMDATLDKVASMVGGVDTLAQARFMLNRGYGHQPKGEAKQLRRFIDDSGHFSLVRNFRAADCITIMNGVCGSLSIFNSGKYLLTSQRHYLWIGLVLPIAGAIFDLMDGKVARWRNESSMLGQELDSLADLISFGLAPAFIAFTIGLRSTSDIFILTTFVCCGLARLARFNATVALIPKDSTGKSQYFEGVPIPSSLILVSCMAFLVGTDRIDGPPVQGRGLPWGLVKPFIDTPLEMHWISLIFAAWAALMVSKTLHVPKP